MILFESIRLNLIKASDIIVQIRFSKKAKKIDEITHLVNFKWTGGLRQIFEALFKNLNFTLGKTKKTEASIHGT